MIKDGLIQLRKLAGIPVQVSIIQPKGKPNVRSLKPMKPKGITLHSTGNTSPSAGAIAHGSYLQNLENKDEEYKSWHITVSHDKIVQHLPLTEQAYHSGDGEHGYGNTSTIGIEIAENIAYDQSERNAVKLIVALMRHFAFDISTIQPHRHYSNSKKLCPRRILLSENTWKEDWERFKNQRIQRALEHYHSLESIPVWGKKTIKKLISKGYLEGDAVSLGLTLEMIRVFVVHDRAGLYD